MKLMLKSVPKGIKCITGPKKSLFVYNSSLPLEKREMFCVKNPIPPYQWKTRPKCFYNPPPLHQVQYKCTNKCNIMFNHNTKSPKNVHSYTCFNHMISQCVLNVKPTDGLIYCKMHKEYGLFQYCTVIITHLLLIITV